jgi:hypothetical protein
MNLNKYTKAELISKFKKLDSRNSFTDKSKVIEFILAIKGLLIKLTLISFLIKIFKKYTFITKILRFANWIILSIFGISFIDNFGLDFLTNFTKEIRTITSSIVAYLTGTQFYSFVSSLFSTKEISPKQDQISIGKGSMSPESSRYEPKISQNKRDSKISEWLKPEPVEIKEEIYEESSNKKYYIIAAMLILSCLSWYYFDDIKPVGASLIERIRSFRPRPGDDPSNTGNNLPGNPTKDLKTRLRGLFYDDENNFPKNSNISTHFDNSSQTTITPIILEDKTPIATSSKVTLEEYPHIQPQLTGLREISEDNFEGSSSAVLAEIDHFFKYHESSGFPKLAVQQGLYNLLRSRLLKLSEINDTAYSNLISKEDVNKKIEKFLDIEQEIFADNTYTDVAQATIEEQDVWSDKANSPSPTILSPIHESIDQVMSPDMATYAIDDQQVEDYRRELSPLIENVSEEPVVPSGINTLLEEIASRRNDVDVLENQEDSSYVVQESKLSPLIKDATQLNDSDLMKAVSGVFSEDLGLQLDTTDSKGKQKELPDLPDIKLDSSSDESLDHFFPKTEVTPEEIQTGFNALINKIDANITNSPNIAQVGLAGPSKLSPLLQTKPSISNLLDDTVALFNDSDEDVIEVIPEVSNPSTEIELTSPVWNNVKVNKSSGLSLSDDKVEINFGDLWNRAKTIRIITNDNQIVDYPFDTSVDKNAGHSIIWGIDVKHEYTEGLMTDLKEVVVIDLNNIPHQVYKNMYYFK